MCGFFLNYIISLFFILTTLFSLCLFWSSKGMFFKIFYPVRSPYLWLAISSVLLSKPQCGFRAHGLFLFLCLDLPWDTRVIQKKVAKGPTGPFSSLNSIINCFFNWWQWFCDEPAKYLLTSLMNCSASAPEPTHLVADVVWVVWLGDTEPDFALAEL